MNFLVGKFSSIFAKFSSIFSLKFYKQLQYILPWQCVEESSSVNEYAGSIPDAKPLVKDKIATDLQLEKAKFVDRYGEDYGYPRATLSIDELRNNEFARLKGTTYLDHAGATLYSEAQLKAAILELSSSLFGNPHSQNSSSRRTTDVIESARCQVLSFFHALEGEYKCIFTSGATGALKLVGETFPWHQESNFYYTIENHNSVLGIREYALARGATATAVEVECSTSKAFNKMDQLTNSFRRRSTQSCVMKNDGSGLSEISEGFYNLFAFPSECNFSGVKFDLDLIKFIQDGGHVSKRRGRWLVLLDAAKSSATSPPDLSCFPADFVAISFYKIFGYPTGLGALLVRNDAANVLEKRYFGGGSVAVSIADTDFFQKRERLEHWFEDGTTSFLEIAALRHGFDIIKKLGVSSIAKHTWALTSYTASRLAALRHWNGVSVCTLYGNHDYEMSFHDAFLNQGPVVTFNLKRSNETWVGYREVENLATLSGIHLRTGCFCNPGACSKFLGLSNADMVSNFEAGHICWDDHDLINGKPTGAIRVSFGYMSSFDDCWLLLEFIEKYFVENQGPYMSSSLEENSEAEGLVESRSGEHIYEKRELSSRLLTLESIFVYPIKSCAGFSTLSWPLGDCGLLYDREWVILGADGTILTQKKVPSMCLLRPSIDLALGQMHIEAAHLDQGLDIRISNYSSRETSEQVELCGRRFKGQQVGPDISEWFSKALGLPCTLTRREPQSRKVHFSSNTPARGAFQKAEVEDVQAREIGFANEGQFLLVSKASLDDLNRRICINDDLQHNGLTIPSSIEASQFRPNLVVAGGNAYDEDNWKTINIDNVQFMVLGGCNRCQMVNVNQQTGNMHPKNEPLLTLSLYRRVKGKATFGVLLVQADKGSCLEQKLHDLTMAGHEDQLFSHEISFLKVGSEVIVSS